MKDVMPGTCKALTSLRRHHEQIRRLLEAIERADTNRATLVRELFVELRVHSILEQQLLFPNIACLIGRERMKETGKDFYVMLALMLELEQVELHSEPFERSLALISERFSKHANEQDSVLFPELEKLAGIDLEGLEQRLSARKEELCEKMRVRMAPRQADESSFVTAPIIKHSRCA